MQDAKAQDQDHEVKRLLIIDDEENMRHMLTAMLRNLGYQIETASNGGEGLLKVQQVAFDFILCDIKMPQMDGMQFLAAAREEIRATTVIMMSAYGSIDTAIEAMKAGAYDYISKPFKPDEVYLALKKAEERERLKRENLRLRKRIEKIEENYRFGNMIGKSRAMQAVFKLAEKVAPYDSTVLITGESGTGKELVARGIHLASDRSQQPLVTVNCGGIPETLLESEFFGYKKGAFTGADRNKKGLFEEADRGTIFLDEIGELPLALQVKLLRVLQESEIRMIGDTKVKKIDVRVIVATAKDLEEEVKQGTFREDLFYRLNVLSIKLPPLRERPEDVPLLCQHFLERLNRLLKKEVKDIAPSTMSILLNHHWPGNVRELENVLERAMILADEAVLLPESLPPELKAQAGSIPAVEGVFHGFSLKVAQKTLEQQLITRALRETNGNRTHAARLLEISHPSLLSKIKAYNIDL
jgi:two-component system response regulator AtoC